MTLRSSLLTENCNWNAIQGSEELGKGAGQCSRSRWLGLWTAELARLEEAESCLRSPSWDLGAAGETSLLKFHYSAHQGF